MNRLSVTLVPTFAFQGGGGVDMNVTVLCQGQGNLYKYKREGC